MRPRDWLLLAIDSGLEPIQIQKTMFKFAMESGAPSSQRYDFEPYNWGPCSFDIYEDIATLRDESLVEAQPSGRGWNVYHLTVQGEVMAAKLSKRARAELVDAITAAREYVTSRSFNKLLRDVYKQYPEYAERSVFSG